MMYRYLNQNTFPPDAEGSQRMTIRYRTDHEHVKKEEVFLYSSSIRRVRHQVPFPVDKTNFPIKRRPRMTRPDGMPGNIRGS